MGKWLRACWLLSSVVLTGWSAEPVPPGMPADKALARLMAGNARYVAHREIHPDATVARRHLLAKEGQHPFAVILGCSDSRVPPEIVFDQGLGDLFVIRDAGNVVDDEVLGSIEYAVEHLDAKLILVLGHEKCGAVSAAVAGGKAHGHIAAVLGAIQPVVEEAKRKPGDAVHNCVVANALHVARQIRNSEPILKELAASRKITVLAADYDLVTGKVILLKEDPPPAPTNN